MLVELIIRNLAVIESLGAQFSHGFHVLTGETGAGKSIIIDALSLIIGGRSSAELVRFGCDKAEIEALFDMEASHPVWEVLERLGIEAAKDESLIIRREITSQGKSTGRINGQLVNLTMLREVGEWLVNIHGQHEHQSLLKVDQHLQWLDLYGDQIIGPVKLSYQSSYKNYTDYLDELHHLQEAGKQALQMMDLYKFQAEEIAAAGLKVGEDELLSDEKRKLGNAEKIFQAISSSYDLIYGNSKGLAPIGKAMRQIEEIAVYDTAVMQPLLEQIQTAYYQLEDASYQLRDYRDLIEFNPSRLDQIEHRLDLMASFRRKYGNSVQEILQYLHKIEHEIELFEHKDEKIAQLQKKANVEYEKLVILAGELSQKRHHVAQKLAAKIESELRELQMERTRFEVQMKRLEDSSDINGAKIKFSKDGSDHAEFMISANPGEPMRPLQKIASGGELSRIMLALKLIFAKMDRIPVLVFDEVDTGVSGRAAQAIAEKLSKLSRDCQVFSITHLPQVACMADAHYAINKVVEGDRTFTQVHLLNETGRIMELARMLGGVQVTKTTEHHAHEMLELAVAKKVSL